VAERFARFEVDHDAAADNGASDNGAG